MKWEKWGNYAKKKDNYSISKVASGGVWKYALWQITPMVNLGWFDSFDEAKAEHERRNKNIGG